MDSIFQVKSRYHFQIVLVLIVLYCIDTVGLFHDCPLIPSPSLSSGDDSKHHLPFYLQSQYLIFHTDPKHGSIVVGIDRHLPGLRLLGPRPNVGRGRTLDSLL
jgi:hypothetical protein